MNGMGVIALPFATYLGGAITFLLVFVCAFVSWASACLITCSLYDGSHAAEFPGDDRELRLKAWESEKEAATRWFRARNSYADNGETAFGNFGRRFVLLIQVASLTLVAALFCTLSGDTMYALVQHIVKDDESAENWLGHLTVRAWTGIFVIMVVPASCLSSLKSLSWLSGFGVLVHFLLQATMFIQAVESTRQGGEGFLRKRFTEDLTLVNWSSVPCALGIVIFSFSCHTLMPGVEDSLKSSERYKFPRIAAMAFGSSAALKTMFMLSTWVAWGPATTDNALYPNGKQEISPAWISAAASVSVICCTMATVPVLLFVLLRTIFLNFDRTSTPALRSCFGSAFSFRQAVRFAAIAVIASVAVGLPQIKIIMAFCGSVMSGLTVFVMPTMFYARIRFKEGALSVCSVGFLAALCALGLAAGVLGLSDTISGCTK